MRMRKEGEGGTNLDLTNPLPARQERMQLIQSGGMRKKKKRQMKGEQSQETHFSLVCSQRREEGGDLEEVILGLLFSFR